MEMTGLYVAIGFAVAIVAVIVYGLATGKK